jgi:hypothetical protein
METGEISGSICCCCGLQRQYFNTFAGAIEEVPLFILGFIFGERAGFYKN